MTHDKKISHIVQTLKAECAHTGPLSLQKDGVSHMVPNPNDPRHRDRKINVRDLKDILSIDVENRIAVAEPGVTFSDLVRETLKVGLMPILVPELKTITIGGAVSGCSVESLSYRYGGFHDSCIDYEVITATGEVIVCSREQNSELFHMMHGSYGTLGILSKLTFRLLPAKRYVKMTYVTYPSFDALTEAILSHQRDQDIEFMDAIVHAPNCAVLCIGTLVDQAPYVSDYTSSNIFYKSTRERTEDYLTIYDYFFRYDTDCHWLTKTVPGMETKFMRRLFGKWLLSSTNLLKWSERLRPFLKWNKRPNIVVDVFIPSRCVKAFYRDYARQINFYPLWVVPYKVVEPYPWLNDDYAKRINDDLFFDVAIYGLRQREAGINYYKLIEEMVYDHAGIKTLIAHNFYDRDTFWKIYNRATYDRIKAKTDPNNRFRNLYDKFNFQ